MRFMQQKGTQAFGSLDGFIKQIIYLYREGALEFMAYLLSPQGGLEVLKAMGQPPFVPCRVPDAATKNKLPKVLADLVEVRQ